jgi:hypothetical protein
VTGVQHAASAVLAERGRRPPRASWACRTGTRRREPSERGIDGIECMRLIRDDINTRVEALARQLDSPRS